MAWWFVRRVSTYAIPTQSCPRRRLARTASSPATNEVHHSPDWTPHGATDADKLFFACGPDHKRVTDGHYHTSLTDTGRLAWTDGTTPPDINHAHHPEELLHGNTDPPHNDGD